MRQERQIQIDKSVLYFVNDICLKRWPVTFEARQLMAGDEILDIANKKIQGHGRLV